MAIRTYTELQNLLADNTSGDISPADIRDIVDTLATRYTVGTYTGTGIATPTTFTQVSLAQFGTAVTAGLSWTSNYIVIRDAGLYEVNYDFQGQFTSPAVIRAKLQYGLSGAAPSTDLPQSQANLEVGTTDEFSLNKKYIINAPANTTIRLMYKTDVAETWNDAEVYVSLMSRAIRYGGA